MARDSSRFISRALISTLKNSEEISALVGARVYPLQMPASPVYPFIKLGVPIVTKFGASCMDGATQRMAIHGFAQTVAGQLSGEVRAGQIASEVAALLDGIGIELETDYPARAYVSWVQNQVLQDGAEASVFHSITSVEVNVVS